MSGQRPARAARRLLAGARRRMLYIKMSIVGEPAREEAENLPIISIGVALWRRPDAVSLST